MKSLIERVNEAVKEEVERIWDGEESFKELSEEDVVKYCVSVSVGRVKFKIRQRAIRKGVSGMKKRLEEMGIKWEDEE